MQRYRQAIVYATGFVWFVATAVTVSAFSTHDWASNTAMALNYAGDILLGGGVLFLCLNANDMRKAWRAHTFALLYLCNGLFLLLSRHMSPNRFDLVFLALAAWILAMVFTSDKFRRDLRR